MCPTKCHDFAPGTRRLVVHDVRQFARWFATSNKERFVVGRVTMRDVVDFRDHLRREKQQAVSTVNRTLVLVRRFFNWLADQKLVPTNPAKPVKELKRQALAPKGSRHLHQLITPPKRFMQIDTRRVSTSALMPS